MVSPKHLSGKFDARRFSSRRSGESIDVRFFSLSLCLVRLAEKRRPRLCGFARVRQREWHQSKCRHLSLSQSRRQSGTKNAHCSFSGTFGRSLRLCSIRNRVNFVSTIYAWKGTRIVQSNSRNVPKAIKDRRGTTWMKWVLLSTKARRVFSPRPSSSSKWNTPTRINVWRSIRAKTPANLFSVNKSIFRLQTDLHRSIVCSCLWGKQCRQPTVAFRKRHVDLIMTINVRSHSKWFFVDATNWDRLFFQSSSFSSCPSVQNKKINQWHSNDDPPANEEHLVECRPTVVVNQNSRILLFSLLLLLFTVACFRELKRTSDALGLMIDSSLLLEPTLCFLLLFLLMKYISRQNSASYKSLFGLAKVSICRSYLAGSGWSYNYRRFS